MVIMYLFKDKNKKSRKMRNIQVQAADELPIVWRI